MITDGLDTNNPSSISGSSNMNNDHAIEFRLQKLGVYRFITQRPWHLSEAMPEGYKFSSPYSIVVISTVQENLLK